VNDAHCHFFSTPFFAALGRQMDDDQTGSSGGAGQGVPPERRAIDRLGWEAPGSAELLADRWAAELDRAGVGRAVLIASVPNDDHSVGVAVERHPHRFVGFFMVDPTRPDAEVHARAALERGRLRGICLFPAMQRFALSDPRVRPIFDLAASIPGTAVFVHCGVLTVGVRGRLGLPSAFDIRFGNPLDLHAAALACSTVPIIIPHFGAGFFREALMVADLCSNIFLDTSSSNSWIKYHHALTLADVFRQSLAVAGPDRLLFGSDSSFFPRGWVRDVMVQQTIALDEIGATASARDKIFGGNFARLFP
jgi:predicted TIM-barrel fold metal-dependent hydrolase